MRLYLVTVLAAVSFIGCSAKTPVAKPSDHDSGATEAAPMGTALGDFLIDGPVVHDNLAIFPILSKTPKPEDRFITLDEGLAAGTVKILEVGAELSVAEAASLDDADPFSDSSTSEHVNSEPPPAEEPVSDDRPVTEAPPRGRVAPLDGEGYANRGPFGGRTGEFDAAGEVNTLMVLNASAKPLYMMPGEVLYGGKQNRTIGEELVIQPGVEPVRIDAYCVEQGRWSGRHIETTTEHLAASAEMANLSLVVSQTEDEKDLAQRSRRGEFIASAGQLNKDSRLAVNGKQGQGKVWEEVAKANAKVDNRDEAGDFAATYLDASVVSDLKPYVDALENLGEADRIVGVAVAVDDQMVCVDIFESTPLFRKFWPKLLKSYALDATASANHRSEAAGISEPCTIQNCIAFLKSMQEGSAEAEDRDDGQKVVRQESSRSISFSFYDAEAAERANQQTLHTSDDLEAGFGGGLGGAVHSGDFAR